MCPEVVSAFRNRGDEIIGHGHTNSERQADLSETEEKQLIEYCTRRLTQEEHVAPKGWLSPWISESLYTLDLLQEAGYIYSLNWCQDDQPIRFATRQGSLWSIPYPQELNDIPAIMARYTSGEEFANMIVDTYDEMIMQSAFQLAALVPKPRVNLTRFHGVFAPNSKHRALVTLSKRGKGNKRQAHNETEERTPVEWHAAMTWAQRLKRVFTNSRRF